MCGKVFCSLNGLERWSSSLPSRDALNSNNTRRSASLGRSLRDAHRVPCLPVWEGIGASPNISILGKYCLSSFGDHRQSPQVPSYGGKMFGASVRRRLLQPQYERRPIQACTPWDESPRCSSFFSSSLIEAYSLVLDMIRAFFLRMEKLVS